MPETVHGYRDGDKVRDRRNGAKGTVRFNNLTPEEWKSGEYEEAEIVWDGHWSQCGLEVSLPYIERI